MTATVIICFIILAFSLFSGGQHREHLSESSADAFNTLGHTSYLRNPSKRSTDVDNRTKKNTYDEKGREAQALKSRKSSTINNAYGVSIRKYDADGSEHRSTEISTESEINNGFVAGIPDISDICFRRYANCIIINAQPYERRSSTTLAACKHHCIHSQIGFYSCKSFVYDNINQVCDLFAHTGDQPPARLLKFQTRDYYEPTFVDECDAAKNLSTLSDKKINKSNNAANQSRGEPVFAGKLDDPSNRIGSNKPLSNGLCPKGKLSRFLRTQGFELNKYDEWILDGATIDECLDACANNSDALGNSIECYSVDFSKGKCVLSAERTVPLGNGQLKLEDTTDYYEKICVDESIASECPRVFDRYPQMILVGFAEVVIDSPTFEHCFDNCLNSLVLHGMRCASGIYYYEEAQLNCILNVEDRTTQKDLFTEENSDIVDYFEIRCENRGRRRSERRFKARSTKTTDATIKGKAETRELKLIEDWSTWSECSTERKQVRTRSCGGRTCAREVRTCHRRMAEKVLNLTALKEDFNSKGISCTPDVCCPVFGGCRIGLIQSTITRRLEWCQNPCSNDQQVVIALADKLDDA
ncbi:Uncharacterized protein F52C9.5 [Toxocara canis]|uniref:Uncharacterized protein F52C9.5 n=1 Tax=Toxocara canis TaxID=6265 RepID=A0A0B2VKQ9_TOXCA|nr:Uncharacterized protein F52C9.5 [Toxocara canis]